MDFDEIIDAWIDRALSKDWNAKEADHDQSKHHFKITFGLYNSILDRLTERELNIEKTMPLVLRMLHPGIKLPVKIWNLTRKVRNYKGDKRDAIKSIIPETIEYLGPGCKLAGLKIEYLHDSTINFQVKPEYCTNQLIFELEKYRQQKGLQASKPLEWSEQFLHMTDDYSKVENTHYCVWRNLYSQTVSLTGLKRRKFEQALFQIPKRKVNPQEEIALALENPPMEKIAADPNPLIAMAEYQGEVIGKYVQKAEGRIAKQLHEIKHLKGQVSKKSEENETMQAELHNRTNVIKKNIRERADLCSELNSTKAKLKEVQTQYKPKNVKRRVETKEKQIMQLKYRVEKKEEEIKSLKDIVKNTEATTAQAVKEAVQQVELKKDSLEKEAIELRGNVEKLQEKVIVEKTLKLRAQKVASKWRRKEQTEERKVSEAIEKLNDEVIELQNENADLRDQLQAFLDDHEIASFENGKYKDEVRQVYYSLLDKGLSIRNVGSTIRTVLKNLAGKKIGRLPQKSLSAEMMIECQILSDQQVGKVILEGPNNTLHLDGTRKKFKEFASFQVTTGDGSKGLSMGIQDMASGSADDYMEATRNIFYHIAEVLLPKGADREVIDEKQAKLLEAFKNVQSDRHIVNKSYMTQLKEYRSTFLKHCIKHFHSLGAEEVQNIVRMNHLFCGMHAIHGMGTVCKDAIKEFESLAASQIMTHGFNKQNARSYDILYEISKALTKGHGNEQVGVVHLFEPYLHNQGLKNKLVSFKGERINILFVIAGAAYYHRNHISDFLDKDCTQTNKLLTALSDVKEVLFQACFRALGIIGKLITGPLLRLVEENGTHIFSLNNVWEHVITKLNEFSANAEPLLEGAEVVLNGKVTKDEIYEELLKETGNKVLDEFTEECLRLLCCSCSILLKRQLQDQLPDGKYYSPSEKVMHETAGVPKQNIISERDFAQLDRKLDQKQNVSTAAVSGLICFANNKTAKYLENCTEEEISQMIKRAMEEKAAYAARYRNRKKRIEEQKIKQMKERREKREKNQAAKEKRKEELDINLAQIGGLWRNENDLLQNKEKIDKNKWKAALTTQIKYRKLILGTVVENKKYLQFSSNKKEFSTEELEENLKYVLNGLQVRCQEEVKTTYVEGNIRKDCVSQSISRKREAAGKVAVPPAKVIRDDFPELVNKTILHKWEVDGKECWIKGKVLKAVGDINDIRCIFQVKYEDEEENKDVPLYEDFKNNDLVVL